MTEIQALNPPTSTRRDTVVLVEGITKRFGRTQALAGVDLAIARGTRHADRGGPGIGPDRYRDRGHCAAPADPG